MEGADTVFARENIWLYIILLLIIAFLLSKVFSLFEDKKEGFTQKDKLVIKTGQDIYDSFYSEIYDDLMYSEVKNNFEIGEIIRATNLKEGSTLLDVGCGTGHHVYGFSTQGIKAVGIDKSHDMVLKAKEYYPDLKFKQGDVLTTNSYPQKYFDVVTCLYFSAYDIEDKVLMLRNCYNWLKPGGFMVIHLVDRENFNPILDPADPLVIINPQKYSKKRITNSSIKFKDFQYKCDFKLNSDQNFAEFKEIMTDDVTGHVRKNIHSLYMPNQESVIKAAQKIGFQNKGVIDMVTCQYEYQYLYVLQK